MEKRTRNWATIIYPRQGPEDVTECPENWAEVLEQMGVKVCVSPLHDKDVKPDGEYKKPHRHVLFSFEGVKSRGQVLELCKKIGGISPEPINSLYAQTRYLTHLDTDKVKYSSTDVLTFGGFEYKRYVNTKEDEEKQTLGNLSRILNLVEERTLYTFHELAEFLMCEEPELFGTMRKNPYFIAQFLKSKERFTQTILTNDGELITIGNDGGTAGLHNPHYRQLIYIKIGDFNSLRPNL